MAATPRDKRRSPRHEVGLAASLYTTEGWVPARSRDLSRGGMCLLVRAPVPVGSEIAIQVRLVFPGEGESEPLDLRARVVWCTPVPGGQQIGAAFVDLTHEALGYLDAFLHFLERQADEDSGPKKGGLFE